MAAIAMRKGRRTIIEVDRAGVNGEFGAHHSGFRETEIWSKNENGRQGKGRRRGGGGACTQHEVARREKKGGPQPDHPCRRAETSRPNKPLESRKKKKKGIKLRKDHRCRRSFAKEVRRRRDQMEAPRPSFL